MNSLEDFLSQINAKQEVADVLSRNLKETHTGAIILDEKQVVYVPSETTAPKKPNKKKDTLQSIIDKVNERFDGQFTEADKVIIEGIYRLFMDDTDVKKFKKYANDNSVLELIIASAIYLTSTISLAEKKERCIQKIGQESLSD